MAIDSKKLELDALEKWFSQAIPNHLKFGRGSASYSWSPRYLAEEFLRYLDDDPPAGQEYPFIFWGVKS